METQEIVIHGGGYVGLIGGVHMALAGINVTFYDPDPSVVDAINKGTPKANEYLGYIDDDFHLLVRNGKIKATTDFDSIKSKFVHLLAVPTEKGDEPLMDIVIDCLHKLHDSLPDKALVIVESTVQPGTIESLRYHLPRYFNDNLFLAVCPRLDWFADSQKNVTNLPRIIGGTTPQSTIGAKNLLSKICNDIHTTNHKVAEFAKAGQNHLYFVQIMAAHEMALNFEKDADMNEALKFIGLHWRLPELYLGAGVSGRCIQMGTQYIRDATPHWSPIAEASLKMDSTWRDEIAFRLVRDAPFGDQKTKIIVLGVAYRPNFSDFGHSAGLDIATILDLGSWDVSIHDPIVSIDNIKKSTKIQFRALDSTFDSILLATAHTAYLNLPQQMNLWREGQFVLDATGAWEKYRKLFDTYKVNYVRVGEEGWLGSI